jgi:hypothetical protein
MNELIPNPHRQQQLYWAQMVELKVAACYIRHYRDYLGKRVTALGTLRAIASSGSIAAWALWKEYAFVWGAIIAASQVVDALKDVFPFTKRHKAAIEHTITLASIFHRRSIGMGKYLLWPLYRRSNYELTAQTHETAA